MFCFVFLLGRNILGTELMAGLCTFYFKTDTSSEQGFVKHVTVQTDRQNTMT